MEPLKAASSSAEKKQTEALQVHHVSTATGEVGEVTLETGLYHVPKGKKKTEATHFA